MYICTKEDAYRIPKDLAAKYQIPFMDHFRDSVFVGHPELFYDYGHLNRKGAMLYSEIISKELKR
jgi:lysophospholipase L1-like esterase